MKSDRRSRPLTPQSQSAMDHLKKANEWVRILDRAFNIDVAIDALSIRPTIGPLALTFKVNVTLNVETIRYTSR